MSSERPNRSRFAPGVSLGRPVEAQGSYAPSAAAAESGGFKPVTGPAYTFRTFRIKENKPAAFPNKLTLLLVYFTCRCCVDTARKMFKRQERNTIRKRNQTRDVETLYTDLLCQKATGQKLCESVLRIADSAARRRRTR